MAASCERGLATAARGQGGIANGENDVMVAFADFSERRARFEAREDAEEDD